MCGGSNLKLVFQVNLCNSKLLNVTLEMIIYLYDSQTDFKSLNVMFVNNNLFKLKNVTSVVA